MNVATGVYRGMPGQLSITWIHDTRFDELHGGLRVFMSFCVLVFVRAILS